MVVSGTKIWQQPQPTGLRSSAPVLSVPDLDGDKVGDVALVASDNTQVKVKLKVILFCFLVFGIFYYVFLLL